MKTPPRTSLRAAIPRLLFSAPTKLDRVSRIAALSLAVVGTSPVGHALSFNFTTSNANLDSNALAGFTAAGMRWSSLLNDNVTINIEIDFSNLGAGILAQAGSAERAYFYSTVKTGLLADRTSAADNTAVAHLQSGSALSLLMNRTSNNPNGSGSAVTFLDNDADLNNQVIRMTSANAKALGFLAGNHAAIDAQISFGNVFSWDFNPTDGIGAGQYDFLGIATHEIGHALGFISGVDVLDGNSPPFNGPFSDNQFTYVSTLDLFRYSDLSKSQNALDWTADTRSKYFSIDGGATVGPQFSTGINFGDGRQASHWKDNLGLGIMDPTAGTGELLTIGSNDLRAMDVIGWNLASVPDQTSSLGLITIGVGLMALFRRRSNAAPASKVRRDSASAR